MPDETTVPPAPDITETSAHSGAQRKSGAQGESRGSADADPRDEAARPAAVTVYWRPGCGFCAGLLRGLERQGLSFGRVNIWDEPEAAEFVRSVARGNETVPTVRIGEVALINPTARDVLRTVAEQAPEHLPADLDPADLEPTRADKLRQRLFG